MLKKEVISYVKIIVISIIVAFTVNNTLITNAKVPTGSMETTVMAGSRIVINRLAYISEQPQRGDIVTFPCPDEEKQIYLKRIVGLPKESIEGIEGQVYINGKELKEDYIKELMAEDFGPYQIPEGSYFLMGDNRNNSWDARFWQEKYVTEEAIIGRAEFEYYPEQKLLD